MKVIRAISCLCFICTLATAAVTAQNGAVVVRGETIMGWASWDGDSVLAILSSDSDFFCNWPDLGDVMLLDWMEVTRPDGTYKYQDRGHYFTRVFYPATEDDFLDDPCALWNNEALLVAEGISHTTYNENENPNNMWGFTLVGMLYDYAGLCEGDMVKLLSVKKFKIEKGADFPACWPDCRITQVSKGPILRCPH